MREDKVELTNTTIIYDGTLITNPTLSTFSVADRDGPGTSQAGRGTVYFIDQGGQHWVLKRYQRGGFIANFSKASYFYTGLEQTRMVREFRLLQTMAAANLPVPRPVAVMVERLGPIYRGSLITERLPASQTLAEIIAEKPLNKSHWEAVGSCIAKFHDNAIYHADLNANNIMLDDDRVYLIDFDKGCVKSSPNEDWPLRNLARLKRSLLKLKGLNASLYFEEPDWQTLHKAYLNARIS